MRRVAFLSYDWDYEIVSRYYLGMEERLKDVRDTQVVIFSGFAHYYDNVEPEHCSFEVFDLCDIADFDGIIVQGNSPWPPRLRQDVVDRARALGRPVVSINYDLEDAVTVGTDNYRAEYGLVTRVLRDHGCASCAFVNGLASSVEAQDRARAYWDACAELGIEDARFYQANWLIEGGVDTARRLLAEAAPLPEVIFCCNDDLAVGMLETLQEAGVEIGCDTMVCGFDNREISMRTTPMITTVSRDYVTVAKTALDTLVSLMDGDEVPDHVASPVSYKLRGSSGYDGTYDTESLNELFTLDNSFKRFSEVLSHFHTVMLSAESLYDILEESERFAFMTECDNAFLTISGTYLDQTEGADLATYGSTSHLMAHAGSRGVGTCDDRHIYATFPARDILPAQVMRETTYVVLPLRQDDVCIGTIVTEGVSPAMRHGHLQLFATLLAGTIEGAMRHRRLKEDNSRLDDLYVHDGLTGLYNRFGLDRRGEVAYRHLLRDFGEAYLTFVDVDDMKGINDGFGHEAGDRALYLAAQVIERACEDENAFTMRYGGDEFLIISRRDLAEKIASELALVKGDSRDDFRLDLSIGSTRIDRSEGVTLDEAIRMADARMYEAKRARRR